MAFNIMSRRFAHIFVRECTENSHMNTCEKPTSSSKGITWAIIGAVAGLLGGSLILTLIWLHCRRKRRDKKEDVAGFDDDDMNDYVLDELEATKPKYYKRPTGM